MLVLASQYDIGIAHLVSKVWEPVLEGLALDLELLQLVYSVEELTRRRMEFLQLYDHY